MKKVFKKMLALAAALMMTLAMAVPAFADGETTPPTTPTTPTPATDATLKITNLTAGDTVDLYKIGTAGDDGVITFVEGVSFANKLEPTSQEIVDIAAKLQKTTGGITAEKVVNGQAVTETTFSYKPTTAGAFIAIIHSGGGADGKTFKVYNPVLLVANLKPAGLDGATVDVSKNYAFGQTAVAKSSEPTVTKAQQTGKTDTKDGQTIDTGSVGDRVKYTVTPTLPDYPANAVNKTMFVSDTMTPGLTFEFDTLSITLKDDTEALTRTDEAGVATFKKGSVVVATAKEVGNGFYLSFKYDNLNKTQPIITYSAIVNDNAVIGGNGNDNHVEYYYASNPTQGETHDKVDSKPQAGENIKKKEDKKTVYTYEIKFEKVDSTNPDEKLEGAVFGLYEDSGCTKLIDTIVTNKEGIGASAKVGAGTYYLKEIAAPKGYSLSTEVTTVVASWTKATTTTTESTVKTTYTSDKDAAVNDTQVGWLKNNKFYAMDEFTEAEAKASNGTIVAAYISGHSKTETSTKFTDNKGAGSGVVPVTGSIPNTKLGVLPSTGSVGTYLFTIIGVAVLAVAAYLIINGKKARK